MNGMRSTYWRRQLWIAAKWLVVGAVIVAVVVVFRNEWSKLEGRTLTLDWGWLAVAAALYLVGSGFNAWFWWLCMRAFGQRPQLAEAIRAFFIGHLGKYVPGKALVIIMRTGMVQGPEVRTSAAALAVAYETLVCMAAGALLAVAIFLIPGREEGRLWLALLLLPAAGLPILPMVFNPVARKLVDRFGKADSEPLPHLRTPTLLGGLLLSILGWVFMGASLVATVRSIELVGHPPYALTWDHLLTCTAYLCVATVAGFFTPMPGGLGAREVFLVELFKPTPLGAMGLAGVVAPLLRAVWILSEVAIAVLLYPMPWISKKITRATPFVPEPKDCTQPFSRDPTGSGGDEPGTAP